jgi:hypothetical protein
MSISYSGIVGYGKVTLPSVEGWGTNTNILKDPPRSITTRKVDKVGQTSALTQTCADSHDRFCDSISYYAKGVDPMKSISYSNTNAGNRGTNTGNSQQAFLRHRIIQDGAFRPPIWRQEDLMPLSRQPRHWVKIDTNKYRPKLTQRILNCNKADSTKEVKSILHTACESAKTFRFEPTAIEKTFQNVLKNRPQLVLVNVYSSKSCQQNSKASQVLFDAKKKNLKTPLCVNGNTSKITPLGKKDSEFIHKEVLLNRKNNLFHDVETKKTSRHVEYSMGDHIEHAPVMSRNRPAAEHDQVVNKTSRHVEHAMGDHIDHAPVMSRNRPVTFCQTTSSNLNMSLPFSNQTKNLKPTLKPSVFDGTKQMTRKNIDIPLKKLKKMR